MLKDIYFSKTILMAFFISFRFFQYKDKSNELTEINFKYILFFVSFFTVCKWMNQVTKLIKMKILLL